LNISLAPRCSTSSARVENFGLLALIEFSPSEMEDARTNRGARLLAMLKARGTIPTLTWTASRLRSEGMPQDRNYLRAS
jgi:hypothetical protein